MSTRANLGLIWLTLVRNGSGIDYCDSQHSDDKEVEQTRGCEHHCAGTVQYHGRWPKKRLDLSIHWLFTCYILRPYNRHRSRRNILSTQLLITCHQVLPDVPVRLVRLCLIRVEPLYCKNASFQRCLGSVGSAAVIGAFYPCIYEVTRGPIVLEHSS